MEKIIHYCWFSKDKEKELPDTVKKSIESWKRFLPDYEIKLWNEDSFDVNCTPWTKECYECGCASYAYLSDYVRVWALYKYGGVYLDSDVQVFKGFDCFLNDKMFMGMENIASLGTAVIGAEKGHPFLKTLLDHYNKLHYINKNDSLYIKNNTFVFTDFMRKSYPLVLDTNITQTLSDITIYPKEYFYGDSSHITDNTYSIHNCMVTHYKRVSVVMAVYNGEKYLRESIDSVLEQSFTNFEFIIVDDGSTDSTASIIKSYKDDRIVYIKKIHGGISEALNLGIRRSIGLYIARIDADDRMYPNRLLQQVSFMEEHKDVDILGGGFEWGNGKQEKEYFVPTHKFLEMNDFSIGNVMGHCTIMMRTSSIKKLPFIYEKIYDGAEDLKLWFTALSHDLKIFNHKDIVTYYRQHEDQATKRASPFDVITFIKNDYDPTNVRGSKLTAIIPFLNEGIEVEKTVTSIRSTTRGVEILLIDDGSTDGFDYKKVADIFGCTYIRNEKNRGVAGSRDLGVSLCKTPYFVLLDAHMRFYAFNWENVLIKLLDDKNNRLITSNTIIFSEEDGVYDNEDGIIGRDNFGTMAACVNMHEAGWEFTAKWTNESIVKEDADVIPVSCVLGAVYATSVSHWRNIGGLLGLIQYGLDEPLMSIKTWMAGGEVLLIKKWGVGHLYRVRGNYAVKPSHIDHNQLYLIHLFASDENIPLYERNVKARIGEKDFKEIKDLFMENYEDFRLYKRSFFEGVVVKPFTYFYAINEMSIPK